MSPEETAGSVEMALGMSGVRWARGARGRFTKGHGSLGRRCGILSNYFDLLFYSESRARRRGTPFLQICALSLAMLIKTVGNLFRSKGFGFNIQ